MAELAEQYIPYVQQNGFQTNKPVVFNGSVTYNGSRQGGVSNVITAAATLTAAQSTSTCVMSSLTGTLFTLPAPKVGLSFDFFVLTANTSGSAKVITDASTTFLVGAISYGDLDTTPSATAGPKFTAADGSTIRSIAMNGTTTGGLAGTYFTVRCITATQWLITGLVIASGTIATPFATS